MFYPFEHARTAKVIVRSPCPNTNKSPIYQRLERE